MCAPNPPAPPPAPTQVNTDKAQCDTLFDNCLQAACNFKFATSASSRGLCLAQAAGMYQAVDKLAGSSYFHEDACPGNIKDLANLPFGIIPVWVGSYMATSEPNNGGDAGVWGDYAEVRAARDAGAVWSWRRGARRVWGRPSLLW